MPQTVAKITKNDDDYQKWGARSCSGYFLKFIKRTFLLDS